MRILLRNLITAFQALVISSKQNSLRATSSRLLLLQAAVVLAVSVAWLLLDSPQSALAALVGGLTGLAPAFYFAWQFSRHRYARQLKQILKTFYRGVAVKLLLTAVLTLIVIKFYPDVAFLPYITGLAGCYMGVWLAPMAMK